ncbi:MAG: hypothetical protein NW217_01695 [Hyphomicrobiaceae bacterium]|nr:hypothetical protein [Hyphomicrobiaceae bacterium]
MTSNLATIGLATTSTDDLVRLVESLATQALVRLATQVGDYAIWRSPTGAEVWLHLGPAPEGSGGDAVHGHASAADSREIIGLTPFFEGRSDVLMALTAAFQRADDSVFEGAFHGWVAPDEDGAGAYPLVFDAIDYAAQQNRDLPADRRVRLCGFARELSAFPDEAAFAAAQSDGSGFAPQSFFPVGLFAAAAATGDEATDAEAAAPSSHALLVGVVTAVALHTNEMTGQTFLALSVDSLEATFDVVAAPDVVTGQVVKGGIVQAACWMFGRLLD